MESSPVSNGLSLTERIAMFGRFDQVRQSELEHFAQQYEEMAAKLATVTEDLEEERTSRRNYRRRADDADAAMSRNQFVLVLVDGDGYIFKNAYLKDASEAGGAHAAHQLYSEVQNYIRANNIIEHSDFEVVVNVYANKVGLAKTLYDGGMIAAPGLLESFFTSFTQSRSLFQFIDCGPGKERADAKLRDTFRFYAYNSHCRHIFLACCHDNGYVAELDKYRHDAIAAPKTTLVHAAQTAREYASLAFPVARFGSVFETSAIEPRSRIKQHTPPHITDESESTDEPHEYPAASRSASTRITTSSMYSTITAPSTHSALPTRPAQITPEPIGEPLSRVVSSKENKASATSSITGAPDTKGIAINRSGQRIDRRMRQPTSSEIDDFEARIRYRKLCNEHYLRDNCFQYKCKYDHDHIDAAIMNTLRFKARGIPCGSGSKCRRLDCYYGHQCPWGNDVCSNGKCVFIKAGLHDITDLEVARLVAPAPATTV